ncbi:hypothetical protein WJX72_001002 [[Myrmecia] bisecta]|uniref:Thioredoxin domain-containing protein n=1 Tax=[Myrmecia] bisecta TaxID=41462 RepID=A0AAW1R4K0_9CHLO
MVQMMQPHLKVAGSKFKDRLQVVKIDVDKYPKLASRFGVSGLPTLVIFSEGQPVDRIEGYVPEEALVSRVQALLSRYSQ